MLRNLPKNGPRELYPKEALRNSVHGGPWRLGCGVCCVSGSVWLLAADVALGVGGVLGGAGVGALRAPDRDLVTQFVVTCGRVADTCWRVPVVRAGDRCSIERKTEIVGWVWVGLCARRGCLRAEVDAPRLLFQAGAVTMSCQVPVEPQV